MVDENTKKEFLAEAEGLVDELNNNINSLELLPPDNMHKSHHLINNAFRAAHSLKGLSSMLGYKKVTDLSHDFENLLDGVRMGQFEVTQELTDLLFECTDVLTQVLGEIREDEDTYSIAPILLKIHNMSAQKRATQEISLSEIIDLSPEVLNVLTEYEEHRLKENVKTKVPIYKIHLSFSFETFDTQLSAINEQLKAVGEIVTTLPNIHSDETDKISFILVFSATTDKQTIMNIVRDYEHALEPVAYKQAAQIQAPEPVVVEAEIDKPPVAELKSVSQTLRVDLRKLNLVMNIIGDLILSKTQLNKLARSLIAQEGYSAVADELYRAAKGLDKHLNELQKSVIDIRMVPIGQKVTKLSRIVRKTSRELHKKIDFVISGEETELDKVVVEEIANPLLHIIRNAIDHGIELPEERLAMGKPETGRIELKAFQKGNNVIIDISDDGQGLDAGQILAIARDRGFVGKDEVVAERDIFNLLFMPGFSTKGDISQLSGRGVGMDVVKKNINALRGSIEIYSDKYKGTLVRLVLPITLAIIQALLVRVAMEKFAIPMTSVIEGAYLEREAITFMENKEVVFLRGKPYPVLRLKDAFYVPEKRAPVEAEQYIVFVQSAEDIIGLVADEMYGQEEIVIKPIGDMLLHVPGIAGATELGDKKPVLIIDPGALVNDVLAKKGGRV